MAELPPTGMDAIFLWKWAAVIMQLFLKVFLQTSPLLRNCFDIFYYFLMPLSLSDLLSYLLYFYFKALSCNYSHLVLYRDRELESLKCKMLYCTVQQTTLTASFLPLPQLMYGVWALTFQSNLQICKHTEQ